MVDVVYSVRSVVDTSVEFVILEVTYAVVDDVCSVLSAVDVDVGVAVVLGKSVRRAMVRVWFWSMRSQSGGP